MDLTQKKCVACEGDAVPMNRADATAMMKHIQGWAFGEEGRWIIKQYKFANFVEAMAFADKIVPVAEREGHHPDLHISWGKVVVEIATHAIKGLSENDFILAAKIDQLY